MLTDNEVSVRPLGDGWSVGGARGLHPLVFRSGARAEACAHALARGMARAGKDARVAVHDRSERLIATARYSADDTLPFVSLSRPSTGRRTVDQLPMAGVARSVVR